MTTPGLSRELDRKKKQRHWVDHLLTWKKSGLTQAEYCRRNQLSIKCFTYWKSKTERPDPSMQLVPVPVSPVREYPQSAELVLVLGDRYRVEVGDGFNPATLEKLVCVLYRI